MTVAEHKFEERQLRVLIAFCNDKTFNEEKERDVTIRKDYIAKGFITPGKGKLNAAELNARGFFAASEGVTNRGLRAAARESRNG